MINLKSVFSIARAERLITRRLVRYWIFLSLAYLIAILYTLNLSRIHGFFSSVSGTVGSVTPHFLMSVIGILYSIIFIVGTVFLAFDIRARDSRERMVEVLDSRPYTNLELVSGRFMGVFLASWIPMVVLAIILELMGLVLKGSGLPMGEPIEIYSLFSFIFIMAVPALSFVIALVFFITLLVRSRLAAAVIIIILLGLAFWGMSWLQSIYGTLLDITGFGSAFFTSDIMPSIATSDGLIQRFSVLFAALSLLGFSAAIHPRLDGGSRPKLAAGSAVLLICALLFSGYLFYNYTVDVRTREEWKDAHAALTDEIVPDVKKISGSVNIKPGKDLSLDLDIVFGAPDEAPLDKALFTFNPGLKVENVSDSTGKPMSFTNENGLLVIIMSHSLNAGEETGVHLTAHGLPDDRFAYLYSSYNPEESTGRESGNLPIFGLISSIFDKKFIALVPALRWLPESGPEKDRDDPRKRAVDYFSVDLKVDLPAGWLAAGPGRRHKMDGNSDGARFRFSPPAPVPEVALVASKFESRSMEVEGVTLEILLNKKHMKNLEVLADTEEKIREWVGACFKEGKEYDLGYPYDAFTLVEVPNVLRSYGGGWRLDTTLAAPGMMLMRETGFPTARFDSAFRNPENFKNREGGIEQAKWVRLKSFFTNDFSGGNLLSGGARNFFLYQTSATGQEALALNYVMETLSNLLITDTRSYFSAHLFMENTGLDRILNVTLISYIRDPSSESTLVDTAIGYVVNQPRIWDEALSVSLKDMDPWEDPARTIDILTLKANPIAQSILDTLGHEKTRQLLASIRESHRGKSFTFNDVVEAGKELGYDLTEILGDWFGSTDLPGFICEKGEIYRIPDSEGGNPRYQLLFTIRNDEPAPGLFRIVYHYNEEGGKQSSIKSDPIRMTGKSTIQSGTIVSGRPAWVSLEPYLSLNRTLIILPLNAVDENKIENKEAIEGIREQPYSLPQETFIIVDDLDTGFSIMEGENGKGLRRLSRENNDRNTDQGLPVTAVNQRRIPSRWSRANNVGSYGKYRHTLAAIKGGDGEKKAVFEASIDKAGQWDLELYVPWRNNIWPNKKWGKWHAVIVDNNGDKYEVEFDSNTATAGWNPVKNLDLPEGKVAVELSDQTDGDLVVADAIKWTPAAGN